MSWFEFNFLESLKELWWLYTILRESNIELDNFFALNFSSVGNFNLYFSSLSFKTFSIIFKSGV